MPLLGQSQAGHGEQAYYMNSISWRHYPSPRYNTSRGAGTDRWDGCYNITRLSLHALFCIHHAQAVHSPGWWGHLTKTFHFYHTSLESWSHCILQQMIIPCCSHISVSNSHCKLYCKVLSLPAAVNTPIFLFCLWAPENQRWYRSNLACLPLP